MGRSVSVSRDHNYRLLVKNSMLDEFKARNPDEVVDGRIKVCIAGGGGFIGSHIAKKLKHEVHWFVCLLIII